MKSAGKSVAAGGGASPICCRCRTPEARAAASGGSERGGFVAKQSVDGQITSSPVVLLAEQQMFSFTRGDFKVKAIGADHSPDGDAVFTVRGKMLSLRNPMVVMDKAGQKVALVQKYLMAAHPTYIIYTYGPNAAGQVSEETDGDDVPVYRFAEVQRALLAISPEFYYTLYDGSMKRSSSALLAKVRLFSLEGVFNLQMDIKVPGNDGPILGTVGKSTIFHLPRDSRWRIEMAKGMDALGMLCLAIAVNAINEDAKHSSGCFGPHAAVSLPNGSTARIDTIRAGHTVAGWPSAAAARAREHARPMKVAAVQRVPYSAARLLGLRIRLRGGASMVLPPFVTPNHPLLAADGAWRAVDAQAARAEIGTYIAPRGRRATPAVGPLLPGVALLRYSPTADPPLEESVLEAVLEPSDDERAPEDGEVYSLELEVAGGGFAAYTVNGMLVLD